MRFLNEQLFTVLDITSNQNSPAVDCSYIYRVSLQGILTGSSPTGTLKLQGSNDKVNAANLSALTVPTNWTDIPNATSAISATGSYLIPTTEVSYQWVRAVWTFTSGTGTITANIKTLGF